MSRPKKTRLCEGGMCGRAFKPTGTPMPKLRKIDLLRDELESLKLCDLEGMTQEEAGKRMGISRGTVQRILTAARKKTAEALVTGAALVFQVDLPEVKQIQPTAPGPEVNEEEEKQQSC